MIASDQPTIFPVNIVAGISSVSDGGMKPINGLSDEVVSSRRSFLDQLLLPHEVAIPYVLYEGDNYVRYATVRTPGVVVADALATTETGLPLFLPLADCTGAILFDPVNNALMVSHLGRHSTEQMGGRASVTYMTQQFNSSPTDLLVWLSPSPNGTDYPLWKFENRSFKEVLRDQFLSAGVREEHIEASLVDTATNPHYFSHSQFLRGEQEVDGRYAIVAMIR